MGWLMEKGWGRREGRKMEGGGRTRRVFHEFAQAVKPARMRRVMREMTDDAMTRWVVVLLR